MTNQTNPLNQPLLNKESGADVAELQTQAAERPVAPSSPKPELTANAVGGFAQRATIGCEQKITVSFFFDGTGNNLDADTPTEEHSNVARLFRAHSENNETTQTFRRYIPGLGTYFKDVKDPGGTKTGKGAGAFGQERLDWAFKELAKILHAAEQRSKDNTSRIVEVRLAVFGFSRGAASARAFCRELYKSCTGSRGHCKVRAGALGSSGRVLKGGYPIDVYFLGIFDTVASVGLPMAANNIGSPRRNENTWRGAGGLGQDDLTRLAFGVPGADPSPGISDGHADWADDLQISEVVSHCVHLVAGHEIRNSFPLDSALHGMSYPQGVTEMVFPGVHSDVGGGYRQGEGGRHSMLSRVPLRVMLDRAVKAGVPLSTLDQLSRMPVSLKKDFALDEAGLKVYSEMMGLWKKYMAGVNGAQALGAVLLAHMRHYWTYRLTVALERTNPANAGREVPRAWRARVLTPEQQAIADNEKAFGQTRDALEKDAQEKRSAYSMVSAQRQGAQQALEGARSSPGYANQASMWKGMVAKLEAQEADAYDRWRVAQARVDGAANDSELIENLDRYDRWLLQDAEWLHSQHHRDPKRRMRPHYRALLDAYEVVVMKKQPLTQDSDIYKFFSLYVHDSLAGFSTDNTRPSDPRVIYIGGDVKYRYAAVTTPAAVVA
ncbi:MAG: DUF2235 domain-containing protein [Rhizobacter sp.]|nr:DUF2235 domain-containing protein [Rhizobacter sp.]